MKRILLAAIGAVVVFVGGRALYRALASDETRIGWVIDDMVEGFNHTRMNPILAGLDASFLDDTYGVDRDTLRAAAAQLFFEAVDPVTKRFLYRVECPVEKLVVADASASATANLEARFFVRNGESEAPAWRASVEGELREQDGDWRFVRSRTTTVEGERIR
ncbi:MAG: hypothetical protein K8S98_07305 [Planctomycetes bacterium]|nr:hypothetical protein [Planctomycetota bacterium]